MADEATDQITERYPNILKHLHTAIAVVSVAAVFQLADMGQAAIEDSIALETALYGFVIALPLAVAGYFAEVRRPNKSTTPFGITMLMFMEITSFVGGFLQLIANHSRSAEVVCAVSGVFAGLWIWSTINEGRSAPPRPLERLTLLPSRAGSLPKTGSWKG